jgi:hypothetical protein
MFTCLHCQRHYQRKIYFDRHVITCEFLSKSKRENTIDLEELADTPTVRELYAIIMGLANKCKQLETKLDAISDWTRITKKKVNIIDWLNAQPKEKMDEYDHWFNTLQIAEKDLERLFASDYVNGVVSYLKERLPTEDMQRPLCAFTSKDNVFYCYRQKWQTVDTETFNKLMYRLDKLFMGEFIKWQNANKHKIHLDGFQELYSNNMKKIMGGNNTREQLYTRIKKELYLYLRSDPPNIMEYEVTY